MAETTDYLPGGSYATSGDDNGAAYDRANPKRPTAPGSKVDATGRPTTGTVAKQPVPLVGNAAGARAFDSATLGLGEKAVGLIDQHLANHIKKLSEDYDSQHPWASAGIDLVVAGATMAIPGVDEVASGRALGSVARAGGEAVGRAFPAVGRVAGTVADSGAGRAVGSAASRFADSSVGKGVGYGAVAGGVRGGTDAQPGDAFRGAVNGALTGGAFGAAGGAALGQAGRIAQPLLEKVGALSASKASAEQFAAVLKKEGKSLADLNKFMDENPNARIADYSKGAAALVTKAGKTSNAAREHLGDTLRADAGGQSERLRDVAKSTPLASTREDMTDEIDRLTAQRDQGYASGRTEITPLTPALKEALSHPDVAPILKDSLKSYAGLRKDAGSDVARAAKYKNGAEIPSAVLEDVQKAVGKAMKKEGTGSTKYGELQSVQKALKAGQTGSVLEGQTAAALLGKPKNGTGILGAKEWGASKWGFGFSQGLKSADMDSFRGFTDLQKEYARLGMLDGLSAYLRKSGQLGEAKINQIAAGFKEPEIREALGARNANQIHKAFINEAGRLRNSAAMTKAAARDEAGLAHGIGQVVGQVVAHVVPGGPAIGHAALVVARTLMRNGMTAKQAQFAIDMAARPGGIEILKKSGVDRKVLDSLYSLRGGYGGAVASRRASKPQNSDD